MPSTTEAPTRLWLAPHVRACALDAQVILLDLRSSRYIAVPASVAQGHDIVGWPPITGAGEASAGRGRQVLAALCARGLLLTHDAGRSPTPALPDAAASLDGETVLPRLQTASARLAIDATVTAAQLRFRSLAQIVAAVRSRRNRLVEAAPRAELEVLVATYTRLRPLLFTSRDECLFDSLTMLRFLSHWSIGPHWVIGVALHPFAAHAWLQSGATVLNDRHERVRRYQPILVA